MSAPTRKVRTVKVLDGSKKLYRNDEPEPSGVSLKSDRSMDKKIDFKGRHTSDRRNNGGPTEPEPIGVSLKSDWSMDKKIDFKGRHTSDRRNNGGPTEPEPIGVSLKSDWSMDKKIDFKGRHTSDRRTDDRPTEIEPSCISYRNDEPEPSGVSLKSDWSMDKKIDFKGRHTSDRRNNGGPTEPEPIGVSLESDWSMDKKIDFKGRHTSDRRVHLESSVGPSGQPDNLLQTHLDSTFKLLEENIITFVKNQLKKFHEALSSEYQECLGSQDEDEEQRSSRGDFLRIAQYFLRSMEQEDLAECLQNKLLGAGDCQRKLKSNLKERFQRVFEGIAKAGNPTLLNQVYTELHITEGGTGEVNQEHEVRQMEALAKRPNRPERTIRQEDLFKPPTGHHGPIRAVMTKGVAGIGKTVLTQRFSLDWAEGKANQDIQLLFPFTFRELNVLKEKKYSLVELVHHYFHETKEAGIKSFDHFQVVFIFDGLDECRPPLDFHNTHVLTDETESVSVDVLLTNLIRGKLLPSAQLWITTRPAAANHIPPECVSMVTEVRGFTDPQKEEYFRKRFRDEKQASRIISHIKTSRSLHIMCHIPVFCWITAGVLEDLLKTRKGRELPKTLTETYIHFLVVQSKVKKVKYDGGVETDSLWKRESLKMIESLGKLAFEQLQKGILIFYDSDLKECSIDIKAASVYSGVFTQIFREEKGLYQERMFCFVHLSVQEFLAALHVHMSFINSRVNLLSGQTIFTLSKSSKSLELKHLHHTAVDQALQSPNGHFDLFLRFLLGLSLRTNQRLLGGLLTLTGSYSGTTNATVKYINEKIEKIDSAEKTINLFHCLNELNDRSLEEDIQRYLTSGFLSTSELSPCQWSALGFILLSSEEDLHVFDLNNFRPSEEVLLRLLPVVRTSTIVILRNCNLSERSCGPLASVLSWQSSNLTNLDLSNNDLKDSGVNLLCAGLESPPCRLEVLRLRNCNLAGKSCGALASVLSSRSSNLTELDLSNNNLKNSGVRHLCAGLDHPHCRLEALWLSGCLITEEGCSLLASALSSNLARLKVLDLSYNHPGYSGVKLLSAQLDHHVLRVEPAGDQWLTPGLRKYFCELKIDPNTISRTLKLSDNNMNLTLAEEDQSYPDHPDRFEEVPQLLCQDALTGCCYWEVQWRHGVHISVSSRRIKRAEDGVSVFGHNDHSWSLICYDDGHSTGLYALHDNKPTSITYQCLSHRVGVYVDCPAGTLSFYQVTSNGPIHLHTFNTTFTEPLYPGFGLWYRFGPGSSVSLVSPGGGAII